MKVQKRKIPEFRKSKEQVKKNLGWYKWTQVKLDVGLNKSTLVFRDSNFLLDVQYIFCTKRRCL